MTTYYDILSLAKAASKEEIEAAIDTQYDKWRRLVNHHDPDVVEEANRSLRVLEQIRAVLLNDQKRKEYDASLNVGGLTDPDALLKSMETAAPTPPAPPPGKPHASSSNTGTPVDAWVCSNCHTPNPMKTRYCLQCGTQVGIDCPACDSLIFAGAQFCPECGVNVAEEQQLKEQEERQERERKVKLAQNMFESKRKARIADLKEKIQQTESEIRELLAIQNLSWPVIGNSEKIYTKLRIRFPDDGGAFIAFYMNTVGMFSLIGAGWLCYSTASNPMDAVLILAGMFLVWAIGPIIWFLVLNSRYQKEINETVKERIEQQQSFIQSYQQALSKEEKTLFDPDTHT